MSKQQTVYMPVFSGPHPHHGADAVELIHRDGMSLDGVNYFATASQAKKRAQEIIDQKNKQAA